MVVYSFYVFDRHAECIYKKRWAPRPSSSSRAPQTNGAPDVQPQSKGLSAEDDAKLVFGTIFSLRNMVKKLGGPDDNFISYRTGHYKLHYYETPTSLKFVMVTDTKTNNLRIVLHQIYVSLYVEYVTKNPLSPVEHPGGAGVNCELFELGVEQFVVSDMKCISVLRSH
ncbi:Longin-like domain-containing protein [Usnea florida]